MDNASQKKKTNEKEKNKPIGLILFSSLAILLLFIGELYVMVVMEKALLEVALVGVAILVLAYLDLSSVIKWIRVNEEEREEQYAGMLKAEKASYLLIRKYFDEIEEQLALMEDKVSDPFQEIVAAQKATAKVTINRNKENTDALMNSNDKLLDVVFGMESKIEEMSAIIAANPGNDTGDAYAGLMQKQIEMSNQMRELELNLKNEIFQAVSKLSNVSPQVVMAPPQMMPAQQAVPAEPQPLGDLDIGDLGDLGGLEDFATLEVDAPVSELAGLEPELALGALAEEEPVLGSLSEEEPVPGSLSEEEPVPGSLSEPEPVLEALSEPEPALEALAEPEPVLESLAEPEPVLEALSEPEPILESPAEPLPEPEPGSTLEPLPESAFELPPMPDLTDPDRELSSDELDGLLANIAAEEASLEPEPQPEEKPPMPDLSDPNRAMSPDEIAALFANLG